MTLPPDFLALLPCTAGWPASFFAGYQFGYRRGYADGEAEYYRPHIRFDQLVLAPEVAPEPPALVQVAPERFVRLSWGMLRREQWDALLRTTATNELCGAGKPFERGQFDRVRALMIARGVAFWKNAKTEKGGWDLTPPMRRAVARYLGYALPRPREISGMG